MNRRRLVAYGVILTLGMLLVWYGLSPIRPSRHGFTEMFAVIIGGITALVGVVGVLVVAIGALVASRTPRE